jgi:hypothetical protein
MLESMTNLIKIIDHRLWYDALRKYWPRLVDNGRSASLGHRRKSISIDVNVANGSNGGEEVGFISLLSSDQCES